MVCTSSPVVRMRMTFTVFASSSFLWVRVWLVSIEAREQIGQHEPVLSLIRRWANTHPIQCMDDTRSLTHVRQKFNERGTRFANNSSATKCNLSCGCWLLYSPYFIVQQDSRPENMTVILHRLAWSYCDLLLAFFAPKMGLGTRPPN